MVDAITKIAVEKSVDAVIIAGDLFDRAIPSVEAVTLWEQAIAALSETGAQIIAIAGNHDSARRVSVHSRILEASGVSIRGSLDRIADPIMVKGATDSNPVAVYAVPYLDPIMARSVLMDTAGTDNADDPADDDESDDDAPTPSTRRRVTHADVTKAALDLIRSDLATRGTPRSVVVAHTFVSGGTTSDSERSITLGNVENVPVDTFDGVDYVALGHLHGPQRFDGGRVAYSGSPLPYSFSEEHHSKSVRIVDLGPDGPPEVEVIPLEVGMRLATIEGEIHNLLNDPSFDSAESAYVRVRLTDRDLPQQAMNQLRVRFPKALEMRHIGPGSSAPADQQVDPSGPSRRERPPIELAVEFFAEQEGRQVDSDEHELLDEALSHALSKQSEMQGSTP